MGHSKGFSTALLLTLLFALDIHPGAFASRISPRQTEHVITTPTRIVPRATESPTAVSGCHSHGTDVFCMYGETEFQVIVPATATGEAPSEYTGCHSHGEESFCLGPDGTEVQVVGLNAEGGDSSEQESNSGERNCHFHAGVEHCVGGEGEHGATDCSRRDRDYNIPLRIGLIFVILATSFIGVAGPIFLKPVLSNKFHVVFIILKQFGTGVIISTAFVHLFTHAELMFGNECLGELEYEATTAAVVMAGLFLAFAIEYISHRLAERFWDKSRYNGEAVGVTVLEAGIIFHSLLIGITLVVAGDSFFITLFIVILFHQMFEGIALGTRIASVGQQLLTDDTSGHALAVEKSPQGPITTEQTEALNQIGKTRPLSMAKKLIMASAYALVTPVGMAIGTGVLHQFNGNDPSTLIALGTLDALSAGILIWVGLVEMWAGDWMFGGEMTRAGPVLTTLGAIGLVAGAALMSFLGKWA